MNQAYSRLSTTHGHITDCKLDSVVYVSVCVVILMWTCLVWAERSTPDNFFGAKPPIPLDDELAGDTAPVLLVVKGKIPSPTWKQNMYAPHDSINYIHLSQQFESIVATNHHSKYK